MKQLHFAALLLLVLGSCRKYPNTEELTGKPIVVTNHDSKVKFTDYKKYYMPTTVALIGDDPKDTILPANLADPLLKAIADNMESRGFVRVLTYTGADLGINSVAIKITTTVTSYPPSYWWGYPGYGGCYYGYCGYYPYYPYYGYSYEYSTGSVLVQMADLKNVDNAGHKLNMVWTNFNAGVLGSQTQNISGGVNAIHQAFLQSPYLKTN